MKVYILMKPFDPHSAGKMQQANDKNYIGQEFCEGDRALVRFKENDDMDDDSVEPTPVDFEAWRRSDSNDSVRPMKISNPQEIQGEALS